MRTDHELGFPRTRFLRPGPLDGDRREQRTGERWALRITRPLAPLLPAKVRPIHVAVVARAVVPAAFDPTPGTVRYEASALLALGGRAAAGGPGV